MTGILVCGKYRRVLGGVYKSSCKDIDLIILEFKNAQTCPAAEQETREARARLTEYYSSIQTWSVLVGEALNQ